MTYKVSNVCLLFRTFARSNWIFSLLATFKFVARLNQKPCLKEKGLFIFWTYSCEYRHVCFSLFTLSCISVSFWGCGYGGNPGYRESGRIGGLPISLGTRRVGRSNIFILLATSEMLRNLFKNCSLNRKKSRRKIS